MRVDWPESEPMPQSMEEALALGWIVEGTSGATISGDERIETGTVDLAKDVGMLGPSLRIPYRAEYTYGQPHSAVALIYVDEAVRS